MKKFIISVDSSANFTKKDLNRYGFLMAHLSYTLNGQEYIDEFENDAQKQAFYNQLSSGQIAQSSKVNPETFKKVWEATLKQGIDILHLSLSSKVSGSFDSACQAANELSQKYESTIKIVDTKTGSFAITAMALELAKIQNSADVDTAYDFVLANIDEYNLIFTVGDIRHLHRGGRISHVKALVGGLLNLKPILFVNSEGKITFMMNARGTKKALNLMAGKMAKSITKYTDFAYISHGGDVPLAEALKNKIIETFPKLKDIRMDYLTPVLGLHAGPGSLVLCFRGAERKKVLEENPIREILDKIHLAK
ncbi:MAG: DegV family protein [Eubacteriales bacterium]|nr:DegV family protein [Eubacteriales bacterium]